MTDDDDERQVGPAILARDLGWLRPRHTHSWSWDLLLQVAHDKYRQARYARQEPAA